MNINSLKDQMSQTIDRRAKARFNLIQARNRNDTEAVSKLEREEAKAAKQQLAVMRRLQNEEQKKAREHQEAAMKAQGITDRFLKGVRDIHGMAQ
jgi:hypothetical protein